MSTERDRGSLTHRSCPLLPELIRMLTELRISHFALIDRLHLELAAGFQVLTGETGAGKSILIDAIAILVGGRALPITFDRKPRVHPGSYVFPSSVPSGPR